MTTVTYRIRMLQSSLGSSHIDALAATAEGVWHNVVDLGDECVGYITVPEENAEYLEELLEGDEKVTRYEEYCRQQQTKPHNPFF